MSKSNNIYRDYFRCNLKKFLTYLRKDYPSDDNVKNVLDKFSDLSMSKVVTRTVMILQPYDEKLNSRDETVFKESIFLIPSIDVSKLWNQTTLIANKDRIWTYLYVLYQLGRLIEDKDDTQNKRQKIMKIYDDYFKKYQCLTFSDTGSTRKQLEDLLGITEPVPRIKIILLVHKYIINQGLYGEGNNVNLDETLKKIFGLTDEKISSESLQKSIKELYPMDMDVILPI